MNKVAIGCVGLLAVGVAGGAGASYYAYHKVTSAIAPVARSARSARSTGPEGNMHRRSRSTSATLILALAPGLVAAARPDAAPCPAPTDIETTIGFPVRAHPQVSDHCMYELTGQYQGIPPIVAWPEETFVAVMNGYRLKLRPNAVMQTIAGKLSDEEIAALAAYFGSLPAPPAQ